VPAPADRTVYSWAAMSASVRPWATRVTSSRSRAPAGNWLARPLRATPGPTAIPGLLSCYGPTAGSITSSPPRRAPAAPGTQGTLPCSAPSPSTTPTPQTTTPCCPTSATEHGAGHWPAAVAPFEADVIIGDRQVRAGVKFSDAGQREHECSTAGRKPRQPVHVPTQSMINSAISPRPIGVRRTPCHPAGLRKCCR
jgi:hypothetical protein